VLSPELVENFTIGARFDVYRESEKVSRYYQATVVNIDVSGFVKRAKFSFQNLRPDADEWIEIGSTRIKALHSHSRKVRKVKSAVDPPNELEAVHREDCSHDSPNGVEAAPAISSSICKPEAKHTDESNSRDIQLPHMTSENVQQVHLPLVSSTPPAPVSYASVPFYPSASSSINLSGMISAVLGQGPMYSSGIAPSLTSTSQPNLNPQELALLRYIMLQQHQNQR